MRKLPCVMLLPCVVAAILLAGSLSAAQTGQEAPNRYQLTLTTQTMALPFKMPALPAGIKIPGMADLSKPTRMISGEATYPNRAVEPIFVTVPGDLALADNKLVLNVPKPPKPEEPTTPGEKPKPEQPQKFELTMKLYWHQETARGPIVNTINTENFKMPEMPRGRQAQMGPMIERMMARAQVDMEKEARGDEAKLPADVVGKGDYQLNTGAISMPLDGFLPAIQVTQPETLADVDPAAGITLNWKPVEGARGYIVHVMEMVRGEGNSMTITTWVSTVNEPPERVRSSGYEQATSIADDLAAEILMPPTATNCIVPPGIFKGDGMLTVNVTAVGNDYYSYDKDKNLTVRGKIRAQWMGMKMKGMPGMGGFPGMGGPPPAAGGGSESDSGSD